MDKETLSHYGWIVILVLVLAVLLALASPFGTFIAGAIKSTTAGLFDVNQAALGSAGIDVNDMVFENCDHLETELRNVTDTYTGDTCCKACGTVMSMGQTVRAKVPEGGKYTAADGTVYGPGEEMPEVVTTGDKYENDDYTYTYKEELSGWGVRAKNRGVGGMTSYGYVLETINGKPITSMLQTFAYLDRDFTLPDDFAIPNTVTDVKQMFYYCRVSSLPDNFTFPEGITALYQTFYGTNLIDASKIVIPSSVTDMTMCFYQSTQLTTAPIIPNTVNKIDSIFGTCTALKTYAGSTDPDGDFSNYVIPNGVTNLHAAFMRCKAITVAPQIPNGVTDMEMTFRECTALTTAPKIPSSVTKMEQTFYGCTSLSKAPDLSDAIGVTNMKESFYGCTSLIDSGMPILPSNVTNIQGAFQNCTALIDLSSFVIPNNKIEMALAFKGCTSLTTAPVIPTNVSDMRWTFQNCTALTGTITINARPSNIRECFALSTTGQDIVLTGSSAILQSFANQSTTGMRTVYDADGNILMQ